MNQPQSFATLPNKQVNPETLVHPTFQSAHHLKMKLYIIKRNQLEELLLVRNTP